MRGPSQLVKARFYTSVGAIYAATLVFGLSALGAFDSPPPRPLANAAPIAVAAPQTVVVNQGKPVALSIPAANLDHLAIDDGVYDPASQAWTLSGNHAQFALSSVVANDYGGNTLIYGHNHWWVFGRLKLMQPGDTMQIFTDNGHVFTYQFTGTTDLQPNDLSVFKFDGPPTVTLQTCAGNWNEIRRMYHFKFIKVDN